MGKERKNLCYCCHHHPQHPAFQAQQLECKHALAYQCPAAAAAAAAADADAAVAAEHGEKCGGEFSSFGKNRLIKQAHHLGQNNYGELFLVFPHKPKCALCLL